VFLFHAWSAMPEIAQSDQFGYLLAKVSSLGHLGVVIFNIVTGLVLSLPHLGPRKADVPNYLAFLRRRFLRILPHYWIALVFWSLLLLGSSSRPYGLSVPFLAHLFLVHTFSPATFFSIVPAYWWLGLLAQFYVIFPLFLRLFQRWAATRCLVVISLVCWGTWFTIRQLSLREPGGLLAQLDYLLYFNIPWRLPEFAAGMWLASAWSDLGELAGAERDKPALRSRFSGRFLILWALILAVVGFWVPRGELPLYHPYLSAWCLLLVIAVLRSRVAATLGSRSWIRGLGKTSYSIYLLHQPVLTYGTMAFGILGLTIQFWPLVLVSMATVTVALSLGLDLLVKMAWGRG
jgi:peptidoglycan/LPS O-acetylase OafA/YrhL